MNVEIKNRKSSIYISKGDILVDTMSTNEVYLVNFSGFDEKNKTLYKLIPLNGSNDIFDEKEIDESSIKQFIIGNRLTHYSKEEYLLSLSKIEKE